jgi:hypothetical protein
MEIQNEIVLLVLGFVLRDIYRHGKQYLRQALEVVKERNPHRIIRLRLQRLRGEKPTREPSVEELVDRLAPEDLDN